MDRIVESDRIVMPVISNQEIMRTFLAHYCQWYQPISTLVMLVLVMLVLVVVLVQQQVLRYLDQLPSWLLLREYLMKWLIQITKSTYFLTGNLNSALVEYRR